MSKKQKMVEWQEQQKPAEDKKFTRDEVIRAMVKIRQKRPIIKSSHGGGS